MKMAIQIETGIPMPLKPSTRGKSKFPMSEMKVGDSFAVDLGDHKSWAFVFSAIQDAQRITGFKFSTRLVEDGKRRVWRVS
jgi:hypothetical protein